MLWLAKANQWANFTKTLKESFADPECIQMYEKAVNPGLLCTMVVSRKNSVVLDTYTVGKKTV